MGAEKISTTKTHRSENLTKIWKVWPKLMWHFIENVTTEDFSVSRTSFFSGARCFVEEKIFSFGGSRPRIEVSGNKQIVYYKL